MGDGTGGWDGDTVRHRDEKGDAAHCLGNEHRIQGTAVTSRPRTDPYVTD